MITSRSNEIIKYAIKIKDKKYSRNEKKCLVESAKLVRELYSQGIVETILVDNEKIDKVSDLRGAIMETISKDIVAYLSDAMTSDGIFAICRIPCKKADNFRRCIVLDGIQDPSNMGAIIRSARAFGFNTILALNCVYPYTYKGIRASMGQIFSVDFIDVTIEQLLTLKDEYKIQLVVADMNGEDISTFQISNINCGIIIGNEGNGVSKDLREIADRVVSIPMNDGVESLNASVSAGIIMYLLK